MTDHKARRMRINAAIDAAIKDNSWKKEEVIDSLRRIATNLEDDHSYVQTMIARAFREKAADLEGTCVTCGAPKAFRAGESAAGDLVFESERA